MILNLDDGRNDTSLVTWLFRHILRLAGEEGSRSACVGTD